MDHSKYSPSGSVRWINCAGSIKAESMYEDVQSPYAIEGSKAHKYAEMCLKGKFSAKHFKESIKDDDMVDYIQEYIDYCNAIASTHMQDGEDIEIMVEKRVKYDTYVQGGFGTLDYGVINFKEKICDVIDLKYGQGLLVDAYENTQQMLYALGVECLYPNKIKRFNLHIVQPRKDNVSVWSITRKDLLKFAKYVKERADLTMAENPSLTAGIKQCQFCKAKQDCKALLKVKEETVNKHLNLIKGKKDIAQHMMTDEQKIEVFKQKTLITLFLKSVADSLHDSMCAGAKYKGLVLKKSKGKRMWSEEGKEMLIDTLGENAYNKKFIGILEAEKQIGKDKVNAMVERADFTMRVKVDDNE